MIELRKLIKSHLKAIHPRVHFLKAPSDAIYPYLVYELEIRGDNDDLQITTLDVDGWDDSDDSTNLEILMSEVDKSLKNKTFIIDSLAITFYLDRKIPLTDDDPQLNRRKYIYNARLYER